MKEGSVQVVQRTHMQLIGNSFHVGVLGAICGRGLRDTGALPRIASWEELAEVSVLPISSDLAPFCPRLAPSGLEEQALVVCLARSSERGHSDVRLDCGVPFRPKAWPRSAIDPSLWRWRVATSWQWSEPEHINVLEARALLHGVKRRFRCSRHLGKRSLALSDSQVCCAIFAKGKTGARRLLPVVKKFNALCLAAGSYPIFAYVASEANPADVPSRWAGRH